MYSSPPYLTNCFINFNPDDICVLGKLLKINKNANIITAATGWLRADERKT